MADARPPICTECGDVMAREWVEFEGGWIRAWLCMCSDDEEKPEELAAWVRYKRRRKGYVPKWPDDYSRSKRLE